MASHKLKTEIEKRTRDSARLIEVESQKLAVAEMVLERLDSILELLAAAGFKVVTYKPVSQSSPQPPPIPSNTVVVQAATLPPEPQQPVKNPCNVCGQEAAYDEPMEDGSKKFWCRPHGQVRMREKAEDAETKKLFGSNGTMYSRPKPNGPPPQKTIIQAPPVPPQQAVIVNDPLKGPFPTNGPLEPPPNNVLSDDES